MTYISKNKQSFGVVAKEYKKYRGSYTDSLYKFILLLTENNKKEVHTILDLGCGVGNSTEPILKMAKKLKINVKITGCDPDIYMLREARLSAKKNKLPITYIEAKAENLPFNNGKFDLVISGAAFHWFATKKAMKEITRVLTDKGAYCVFWTQNIKSETPTIGEDLYRKYQFKGIPKELRDPNFVKNLFVKSGFTKVKNLKVPWTETKTIDETIGLIKTNSGYAILSPENKKEFIKLMMEEHKKILGKKRQALKQEIHICYGFK